MNIYSITRSNLIILSYFALLCVFIQYLSLDTAEAQSSNKIEYVYNIEMMKGHLEQAIANKENGNNSLTQAHILHPIAEIYDFIEVQLGTADSKLNSLLFNSLNNLSKNVEKLDATQFKEDTEKVNQMLDKATKLVVPQSNSTLNLIAASWLLDTAESEYESGVNNGKITFEVEYQDALGFISRSQSLLNQTLPLLNQTARIPAEEAKGDFAQLNLKTQSMADINDIRTTTTDIKQKLSNITGLY
jgi:hypothetical protein